MKPFSLIQKIALNFFMVCLLGWLVFLFLYVIPSRPGDYFNVSVIYMFACYGLLYAGLFILLLRAIRILKNNNSFLYLFFGVANVCAWVFCIFLFLNGKVETWWLHRCFLNLIPGLLILLDAVLLKHSN